MREWFELLTDRSESEIATLLLQPMAAKKQLGKDIAGFYHGTAAAGEAEAEWTRRFSGGEDPTEIPEVTIPPNDVADGKIGIGKLLVLLGLAKSGNEARRHVESGGVTIGPAKQKITDPKALIAVEDGLIVRFGPRRVVRVRL